MSCPSAGIEHRLFSFISINWRGRPLRIYETIISLIGNTTNGGGLVVRARLDRRRYPTGKKVSAKELRELNIQQHDFHGDWNYVIHPRKEIRWVSRRLNKSAMRSRTTTASDRRVGLYQNVRRRLIPEQRAGTPSTPTTNANS